MDFPDPVAPTRAIVDPAATSKVTDVTPRVVSAGGAAGGAAASVVAGTASDRKSVV